MCRPLGARRWAGAVALCAALAAVGPASAWAEAVTATEQASAACTPPLRASGRFFVDPMGRAVILRGVNLPGDAKVPPFAPAVSGGDLDRLRHLGMNAVRLLFIWEAYEPAPGRYDEAYLAEVRAVAAAAWARGMYVILDIHQDGFSRFASWGSGDGFPAWAVSGRLRVPDNGPRLVIWPVLMATDRTTHRSFADFFTDASGVRTRYIRMLARVAGAFAATPGVIGYDLLNEPWGDEPSELGPLYRDAGAAIRARHPGAILFLEGHVTTNSGIQSRLPRPAMENVAYAPHYYKPVTVVLNRWQGSTMAIDRGFRHMAAKAEEWGVPLFVGEFGIGGEARNGGAYVEVIQDRLDACLASGAQWNYTPGWNERDGDGWNGEDYSILDRQGRPRPNFRPRPYPRLTSGRPLGFAYEGGAPGGAGRFLDYCWEQAPGGGVTEIFIPDGHFPGGSPIEGLPAGGSCWHDPARQVLVIRCPGAGMVRIRLAARR